jgi:hypothetical protein
MAHVKPVTPRKRKDGGGLVQDVAEQSMTPELRLARALSTELANTAAEDSDQARTCPFFRGTAARSRKPVEC